MNEIQKTCLCGCGKVVLHPHAAYIRNHKAEPGSQSTNDMLDARCAYCHAPIRIHRWRLDRFGPDNVYCCRQHAKAKRSEDAMRVFRCEQCGIEFRMKGSKKQGAHIFCSYSCFNHYRVGKGPRVNMSCAVCGKVVAMFPSAAARKVTDRAFCSKDCFAKGISGEGNGSYTCGAGRHRINGPGWRRARRAALKRDGGVCQDCGATPENHRHLHVHHVKPFRLFDGDHMAANDLGNLTTLCGRCHSKAEAEIRRAGI